MELLTSQPGPRGPWNIAGIAHVTNSLEREQKSRDSTQRSVVFSEEMFFPPYEDKESTNLIPHDSFVMDSIYNSRYLHMEPLTSHPSSPHFDLLKSPQPELAHLEEGHTEEADDDADDDDDRNGAKEEDEEEEQGKGEYENGEEEENIYPESSHDSDSPPFFHDSIGLSLMNVSTCLQFDPPRGAPQRGILSGHQRARPISNQRTSFYTGRRHPTLHEHSTSAPFKPHPRASQSRFAPLTRKNLALHNALQETNALPLTKENLAAHNAQLGYPLKRQDSDDFYVFRWH